MKPQEISELINYDGATGNCTWAVARRGTNGKGSLAGTLNSNGYIQICLERKIVLAHRLAWFLTNGILPKEEIDHINGNRSDNRIVNLREATRSENQQNAKLRKDNSSGTKGVVWNKRHQRWAVVIQINKKPTYFGEYLLKGEAEAVAKAARSKHHDRFANHG